MAKPVSVSALLIFAFISSAIVGSRSDEEQQTRSEARCHFNGYDISFDSPLATMNKLARDTDTGIVGETSGRAMEAQEGSEGEESPELDRFILHTTEGATVHQLQAALEEAGPEGVRPYVKVMRQEPTVFHVIGSTPAVSSLLSHHRHVRKAFSLPPLAKLDSGLRRFVFPVTENAEAMNEKEGADRTRSNCPQSELTVWFHIQQKKKQFEAALRQSRRWQHLVSPTEGTMNCKVLYPLKAGSREGPSTTATLRCTNSNERNLNPTSPLCPSSEDLRKLLTLLTHLPAVKWVEQRPRFQLQNNVATVTVQNPTLNDNAPQKRPVWDEGITGRGQIGLVGDTGVDYDSCYFYDANQTVSFYPATNPKHRKVLSYVECDDYETLDHGDREDDHGTHVAGSFAGSARDISPTDTPSTYNGMAKDAKIVIGDMNCGGQDGVFPPGDIREYYLPGYELGATVTSNSWGQLNYDGTYAATERYSDIFAYDNDDFLLVFSAGNYGADGSPKIISPSSGKNILTVGANYNSFVSMLRDGIPHYSSPGPTYGGRIKPEVTGPGDKVTSARSDGDLNSRQCTVHAKGGTSMATPLIGGSALLVRQYLVEGYYPSGVKNLTNVISRPTSALLKAMLIHGTNPGSQSWPDDRGGFGRVELDHMLFLRSNAPAEATPFTFLVNNETLRQGESARYCFEFSPDLHPSPIGDIRATLVWTDPASVPEGSGGNTVVNDLDLVLVNVDGRVQYSNGLSTYSNVNNVEVIRTGIANNGPRAFAIEVSAKNVVDEGIRGGQPFALVVWAPKLHHLPLEHSVCTAFHCPNGCKGHGTCTQGKCQCNPPFYGVDCSHCDHNQACHGNSLCNGETGHCLCDSTRFDVDADPTCGTCKTGWYGPHCSSRCACGPHGTCNTKTGECNCFQNSSSGYWGGASCEHCSFDHAGTECKHKSFWCVNKEIRTLDTHRKGPQERNSTNDDKWEESIVERQGKTRRTRTVLGAPAKGEIQVNGRGRYINGHTCSWHIIAAHPQWRIKLSVVWFDIEKDYDHLRVYDGESRYNRSKLLVNWDGIVERGTQVESTGPEMFLVFVSDYVGDGSGFTLQYEIAKFCSEETCHSHGHCNVLDTCTCTGNYDPSTNCAACLPGHQCSGTVVSPSSTSPVASTSSPSPSSANGAGTESPTTLPPVQQHPCKPPGYTGPDLCSGRGWCDEKATEPCSCSNPDYGTSVVRYYAGKWCELDCPQSGKENLPCGGHAQGMCTEQGVCYCIEGFLGKACGLPLSIVQWLDGRHSFQRLTARRSEFTYVGYKPSLPDSSTTASLDIDLVLFRTGGAETVIGVLDVYFWPNSHDAGDTEQAVYHTEIIPHASSKEQSGRLGIICFNVLGWSSTPRTPSIIGLRLRETTGTSIPSPAPVMINIRQQVVLRCGATSNSVCNVSSQCTRTNNEVAAALTWTPAASVPVPGPKKETRADRVKDALGNKALVFVSILLGLCAGLVVALVMHLVRYYRKRQGRGYDLPPGAERPTEMEEAPRRAQEDAEDEELSEEDDPDPGFRRVGLPTTTLSDDDDDIDNEPLQAVQEEQKRFAV